MRLLKRIAICALACLILSACAQTMGGVSTERIDAAVCQDWKPQRWHSKDHDITIADAKGNNARRKVWCN